MSRSFFLPCLVASLLTLSALAQDYRGRVQGSVNDASGAPLANARVSLLSSDTGLELKRETSAAGQYLFDFVTPGTWTVIVEAAGFNRFRRENITVQTRGDVTIDAQLSIGNVTTNVDVTDEVVAVQMNTSSMEQTINGTALKELPVLARNPFTLTLLNPAVVNQYWDIAHRNPFYMHSSNGLDVGGSTGGKNDLLLDGVPLGVGSRGSYAPPMDATQEVAVQQNAVDAEFGFSAGGVFTLSMKSGTNQYHGTGYYFGRNPAFNAVTNAITRNPNTIRNHIGGGTVGGPIIRNKLFTFFSYERWNNNQPNTLFATLPTAEQRTGNFSRTLTPDGQLRPIYDPMSTQFNSATGTVTRTPFAGNIVPTNRFDPTGVALMSDLWQPNATPDDASGLNNYKVTYPWQLKYWNFSNRTDYNINEKWRMYARYSSFRTRLDNENVGGTAAFRSDNGGLMDALNAAMDVLYQYNPTTVFNFRYGTTYVEDDYDSAWAQSSTQKWGEIWPRSNWYNSILQPLGAFYYPRVDIGGMGNVSTGMTGWWFYRPRQHNYQVSGSKFLSRHQIKFGQAYRRSWDASGLPDPAYFSVNAGSTANTFNNPDLTRSGDPFASLLLGVPSSGYASYQPFFDVHHRQWAFYVHDDFKLTRNITLNLGLRYEYETAPWEQNNMISRFLDLTSPIPEMQGANAPRLPAEATALGASPTYNGAWVYADESNNRLYQAQRNIFLPRAGVAWRLSDRSSFRAGWGRWATPMASARAFGWNLPFYGFSQYTNIQDELEGRPRTSLSNPFPASNPLIPPVGKAYGRYTNLGSNSSWYNQNQKVPINDRINFSYQRQLPGGLLLDATFFMNFGSNVPIPTIWGSNGRQRQVNMVDPNLVYRYGARVDQAVPNPFYNFGPVNRFPGELRNQETVSVRQLMRPYPQYGDMAELFSPGFENRYRSLQLRVERAFKNGINFQMGYNWNRETNSQWFNDIDQYANKLTMIQESNPQHRISMAGTAELPFGKGRRFANSMHPVLNAMLGGWSTSHIFLWNGGSLLGFGPMAVSGDPTQNVPAGKYFNTSVFSVLPAYTPRTNPWNYSGLRGPAFWQLDSTLVKYFPIKERYTFELRLETYNTTNSFIASSPVTNVNSGVFGRSNGQANTGREVQYTARFRF
jgi:hypothetical protein